MQDELLRRLNGDLNTKEALQNFFVECINEEAISKMYKGEDVSHIKDAKDLLDNVFEQLNLIYGIKEKTKSETNQSK